MNITIREPTLVGVISDTHDLLRPKIERLLGKCDIIVHAGDIGNINILHKLECIAPVVAVRGNTDTGSCFKQLPETKMFDLNGVVFYVIHNLDKFDSKIFSSEVKVVISGHTHKPKIFEHNGVIYVNPGSAGYYRIGCPIAMAFISLEKKAISLNISRLDT